MNAFETIVAGIEEGIVKARALAAELKATSSQAEETERAVKQAQAASSAEKTDSARSEATTPGGRVATSTSAALGAVTNAVIQSEGRRT